MTDVRISVASLLLPVATKTSAYASSGSEGRFPQNRPAAEAGEDFDRHLRRQEARPAEAVEDGARQEALPARRPVSREEDALPARTRQRVRRTGEDSTPSQRNRADEADGGEAAAQGVAEAVGDLTRAVAKAQATAEEGIQGLVEKLTDAAADGADGEAVLAAALEVRQGAGDVVSLAGGESAQPQAEAVSAIAGAAASAETAAGATAPLATPAEAPVLPSGTAAQAPQTTTATLPDPAGKAEPQASSEGVGRQVDLQTKGQIPDVAPAGQGQGKIEIDGQTQAVETTIGEVAARPAAGSPTTLQASDAGGEGEGEGEFRQASDVETLAPADPARPQVALRRLAGANEAGERAAPDGPDAQATDGESLSSPTAATARPGVVTPTVEAAEAIEPAAAGPTVSVRPTLAPLADSQAEPTAPPVVDQIAESVQATVGRGGRQIVVQLQPPRLGRVRLTLEVDGPQQVRGVLQVDNARTLLELQREAPGLVDRLADGGINLRRLDMQLTDSTGGDAAQSGAFAQRGLAGQQDAAGQQGSAGPDERDGGVPADEADPGGEEADRLGHVADESINVWI